MRYPQRFSHLVTHPVVVTKLAPTCAAAFNIDAGDALERIDKGAGGSVHEELLAACWDHLRAATDLSDEELIENIAATLKRRGERPGKVAKVTPGWNAFLVMVDIRAGTASDTAQGLIGSDHGKKLVAAGLQEAAKHLAKELITPKK